MYRKMHEIISVSVKITLCFLRIFGAIGMVSIKSLFMVLCILGCMQLLVLGVLAEDTATLQLQGSETYYTNNDTIFANTYPLQYTNSISTLVTSPDTTISNVTYSLGVDNMAHIIQIDEPQYVTKNSTDITWVFPDSIKIKLYDFHLVGFKTDFYSPQYLPMTLKRSMNQTEFTGEGYQKASFQITFENITYAYGDKRCDSIAAGINSGTIRT